LNQNGDLNIDDVAKLAGMSKQEVIDELGDLVYNDPAKGWSMADEYLSGDVVAKLKQARQAARIDKSLERNVRALEAVQPPPLAPKDITVQLGTHWVLAADVQNFAAEALGEKISVAYSKTAASWSADGGSQGSSQWSTGDRSAGKIMDAILNNRQIRVTYRDSEGKTILDTTATEKANDVAKKMKEEFKRWIWSDAQRTERLTRYYNENFNNIVPRQFDGSHLTLPGVSLKFNLYPHQKRAIWRAIQNGNAYMAHSVGAGKTFSMIAAAMEERRLGLSRKPAFVVPNHMLAQFSKEFLELYPTANIMVADEKNFHTRNRQRFVAQAALNDPDAIIMTHSSFERIGMSAQFQEGFIKKQIDEMRDMLEEVGKDDRLTTKRVEQMIEQLENKLAAQTSGKKRDQALTFEEMGIDRLYVDEAHEFRKLDFATSRNNIKGIDPQGSQKAMDLFMKVQYLEQEKNPGRSLVMASGTPITNTMGELYTIQRFFQQGQLEKDGLEKFDAWSNHFGEVVEGFEQNAAGGYQIVSRFAKFVNVADLMSRVRSFMDVLTSNQLGDLVQRPNVKTGSRQVVVTPLADGYKEFQTQLSERIEAIKSRSGPPAPGDDIMLSVITDGRLSAIDMRFVDPTLPADPNSKLNVTIDQLAEAYNETADWQYRSGSTVDSNTGSTLMLFTDLGLGEASARNRGFNMKEAIRDRLIEQGVKPEHIAFMRDYKQHAKKERLFADLREGKKRILIGGKDMETGVNVQKRLSHLFHLDAPWFPASVEQREGRAVRQGNQNSDVDLRAYAAKGSYDSSMWGMIGRKARFIEQAMSGDATLRSMDDVSEASSFEMASALASGDERYLRLAGLRNDVERLNRLYSAHEREQQSMRGELSSTRDRVSSLGKKITALEKAVKQRSVIEAGSFSATLGNTVFDSRDDFGAAAFQAFKEKAESFTEGSVPLGKLGGFDLTYHGMTLKGSGDFSASLEMDVPGDGEPLAVFPIDPAMSVKGIATRAVNQVNRLDRDLSEARESLENNERRLSNIESRIGSEFAELQELTDKTNEMTDLEVELSQESEQVSDAQNEAATTEANEGSADDTRYSQSPRNRPEAPPTAAAVKADIDAMRGQLGDVVVVESTTELPPMSLLKMALNGVNPLDVRGFYEGNRLYVIAANNDSVDQAVKTAIHEAVGHKGVRGVLGDELVPVMRQLYNRLPHSKIGRQARDEVLRDYPFLDRNNPDDQVTIAEEMVAHLIEKGHRPAAWQRAVAKIKELLRRAFPAIPWTTTDVLELGEKSRDYLRRLQAEADQGNADNMTFAMRRRVDQSRVSDEFTDLDADQAEALDMIGPLSATGSAMAKVREVWDRAAVKLRAGLVDKYAALKELDEKALGRDFIESSTASSSWILARMAPAAQGALHTMIHSGRIRLDPEQKVIELQEGEKNSLHEVLAQLGDAAEVSRFMGWIAGNRAEKLREQGRENYFEERHIRGLMELNNGRAKNGEARRTLYPKVFEQFQAIRDDVLSIAEQSGLLRKAVSEPEAALVIARQYGAPEALINKIKRADISMRNDADGDMLDNAQAIYAQARQELEQWLDTYVNDTVQPDALNTPDQQYDNIMQEWASLTRDQREIWAEEFYVPFYRVLDENTHDVQGPASTAGLTRQRAYQRLKGADMRIGDLLENTLMNYHHLLSASLKNQAAMQAIDNAVAVGIAGEVTESSRDPKSSTFILRDGKQVFYEISDDLVYKALVNMTDAGMKAVMDSSGMKAMRWFKRLLTNMVTITPEFVAANTIRDSLQSAAVTPAGMNPLWNAVRGAGYYANKRNRAQMIASGGSFNFGHLYGDRSDELKAQLNRNLRRAKVINDPAAALQAGKFLWRRWNEATEFAENINRAKVYQANLDKGKLYAAFQARDLMDFSGHGSWFMTRFLIDTVPFLNARIQGLDKLYRDGFKPTLLTAFGKGSDSDKVRAKRFSIVTGALMVASIGLLMHNNDDEEYQALPEWQKDTYWYIRNGDDAYFIPKPFEVGAISTMAERVTQQFIDDTAGGDLFKERLWHMISQTFSFSPVPQAAAPLLDIYANRDPFRDRPIEPYWDQQLSPSLRFRSSTTMPARWLSGGLENAVGNDSMLALSPLQIDYLVNGYLGSVGGYAAGMADTFWRRANGQRAPSSRWTESRPIRRFYRDLETPAYSTRYMDVFYKGLQEADRVYSDLRKMEEMGAIEE
ncbi:MAG TPA: hypothetical protein DCQ42_09110, partial [Halomonas sp.]|nr:hypothetical protein [Halomonas sp.]